jgi:tetratricopeptide (TPR) repeat protein
MKNYLKISLFPVLLISSIGLLSFQPVPIVPESLSKLASPLKIDLNAAADNWLKTVAEVEYKSTAPESEFLYYGLFNLGTGLDERIKESGNKDVEECEKKGQNYSSRCYLRSFRNNVLYSIYSSSILRETSYKWLLPGWKEMVSKMDETRKKLLSKIVNHMIEYSEKFDYSKELAFYKYSLENGKYLFISEYPVIKGIEVEDESLLNPYRKGEAWIFRRIHSKQMTISDIKYWMGRIKSDLSLDDTNESYVLYPRKTNRIFDSAEARISRKDYSEAIKEYNKGLEIVGKSQIGFLKKDAEAFYNRAFAKYELKDTIGAVKDLDVALKIDPDHIDSYYLRGKINCDLEKYIKALSDLNHFLQFYSRDILALKYRALSNYFLGDYTGSIDDLTKVINTKPQTFFLSFGKPVDFTRVITAEDQKGEYYYLRGLVRNSAMENDSAISDLNKAIELYYKTTDVFSVLGNCWFNKGDYRKAIRFQDQAIDLDKQNSVAFYRRGVSKNKMKEYTSAINDFDKSLIINSQNSECYVKRANSKYSLNDFNGAIVDYRKATDIKPDDYNSFFGLCLAYSKLKDYASAIESAKKGLEIKPDSPVLLGNLGYYYLESGDLKSAQKNYLQAIQLKKENIDVILGLSLCSFLVKDKVNALKYYEEAKRLYPKLANGMEGIASLEAEGYFYSEEIKIKFEKMFKKIIR